MYAFISSHGAEVFYVSNQLLSMLSNLLLRWPLPFFYLLVRDLPKVDIVLAYHAASPLLYRIVPPKPRMGPHWKQFWTLVIGTIKICAEVGTSQSLALN